MANSAMPFIESVHAGTADEAACIVIWHLVRTLNGAAKIDLAPPQPGWLLRIVPSPDARYVNIYAEGKRRP